LGPDKAGQTVPHHAAPAIWRAKRAVVIGDPFQVEPVMTFDRNADSKLADRRGVPDRLRATLSSAQGLADNANEFGATLPARRGSEPSWVGCPLIVHRRCVSPMFRISNRLAYHGRMVLWHGKAGEESDQTIRRPLLGRSVWIDVGVATGGPKHFIREQADITRRIVTAFRVRRLVDGKGLPEIFVISPFRSVADGTRALLVDDLKAATVSEKEADAWGEASVGTVHKFQGREQEAVVLVLGGTSDGAIAWASGTPNILNVAVTRAQRRLYVVGDRRRWMANELVGEMSVLPVIPAIEAIGKLDRLTRVVSESSTR
jgi:superfamily I DNA and/or RNA helicase